MSKMLVFKICQKEPWTVTIVKLPPHKLHMWPRWHMEDTGHRYIFQKIKYVWGARLRFKMKVKLSKCNPKWRLFWAIYEGKICSDLPWGLYLTNIWGDLPWWLSHQKIENFSPSLCPHWGFFNHSWSRLVISSKPIGRSKS